MENVQNYRRSENGEFKNLLGHMHRLSGLYLHTYQVKENGLFSKWCAHFDNIALELIETL